MTSRLLRPAAVPLRGAATPPDHAPADALVDVTVEAERGSTHDPRCGDERAAAPYVGQGLGYFVLSVA